MLTQVYEFFGLAGQGHHLGLPLENQILQLLLSADIFLQGIELRLDHGLTSFFASSRMPDILSIMRW